MARPIITWRSRPRLVRHRVASPRWTAGPLRLAFISDFHVVTPWTTLADIAAIVRQVNAERPDLIALGGDFLAERQLPGRRANARQIVDALVPLRAPLGVFAILGNHDWKDCRLVRETAARRASVIEALDDSPIRLLRNEAVSLGAETPFWLVGIDSQRPFGRHSTGRHDPDTAFAAVPDDAPAILLAHEPECFGDLTRPLLQISGHTHGGQINLFGWRPVLPSGSGARQAWGHMRDGERHLIVSGGIGFSGLPLRIGMPPEITLIEVSGA